MLSRDNLDRADECLGMNLPNQAQALAMVETARSLRTIALLLEQIKDTLHGLALRP